MCTKNQLNLILSSIAKTAKTELKEKYEAVILYGSYARGDFDKESDIDIMVLADIPQSETFKYKRIFTHLTSELGLEYDIVITVTLQDSKIFHQYLNAVPYYKNVYEEGVRVAV